MSILDEAAELINGQRAQDYGDVSDNFQRIADLWFAYRYDNLEEPFTPHDVAMMMVLVKVARQSNGYHRDSAVDIAGYAALDAKLHPERPTFTLKFDSRPEPRVWESLTEVLLDLEVSDPQGLSWWGEGPDGTTEYDEYGPFTEILDIEPEGSE